MRKYDIVLFDFDGTLMDSEPGIKQCITLALDHFGFTYDDKVLHAMIGPPFRVSMREFFHTEGDVVEEMISIYRGRYETDGWKNGRIYDGVEELLKKLKADGFTLAVATSKPLKFTNIIIDGFDLRKYFDFIGGAEYDGSRDSKTEVIEYVLENLGVEDRSRVVLVGDRKYDTIGAAQSGIDCVGVLWGYGTREELQQNGATYILETPADVYDFLTE